MCENSNTRVILVDIETMGTLWLGLIELEHQKNELIAATCICPDPVHTERILNLEARIANARTLFDPYDVEDLLAASKLM